MRRTAIGFCSRISGLAARAIFLNPQQTLYIIMCTVRHTYRKGTVNIVINQIPYYKIVRVIISYICRREDPCINILTRAIRFRFCILSLYNFH